MIPTFLGITLITFCVLQIVPGGPLEQEIMKNADGCRCHGVEPVNSEPQPTPVLASIATEMGGISLPAEALEENEKILRNG
jgi:ABC-type microcin C transport system permease subunit YejB